MRYPGLTRWFLLAVSVVVLTGCPVWQSQGTPVSERHETEAETGTEYVIYVPSTYDPQKSYPLAVLLHGTYGWDGKHRQVMSWKALAEEKEFIVVAPHCKSVQGILPVIESVWFDDLAADEKNIFAVIDEVSDRYNINRQRILLSGFSAGAYPMWYTGLRNPETFHMLISRDGNSDDRIFEKVEETLTDETRRIPVVVFVGKDNLNDFQDQSWASFRWLRRHGWDSSNSWMEKVEGAHLRRPEMTYQFWSP